MLDRCKHENLWAFCLREMCDCLGIFITINMPFGMMST